MKTIHTVSESAEPLFPAIGVSRLRMTTDGAGVTTLAACWGCTLRCRYCLNPQCYLKKEPLRTYTVQELLSEVRIDDLYFQATGGGVVFGGGEPLLYAPFIHAFRRQCPPEWKIGLESSLAVDSRLLEQVAGDIDFFLIDIKDMNPRIYKAYTGRENDRTVENLRILLRNTDPDRIRIRIPLIDGFNTDEDRISSRKVLEQMGFCRFDLFSYDIPKALQKAENMQGGDPETV